MNSLLVFRVTVMLLVSGVLAACSMPVAESTTGATPELITLERTACFGFCPIYSLAIYGDGRVQYEGVDFVDITGSQTATIDPQAVQALADAFAAAGYYDWQDEYTSYDTTDSPSAITSITLSDGTTKRIDHYHGDRSAPEGLRELEDLIDATANSAQWIGEVP